MIKESDWHQRYRQPPRRKRRRRGCLSRLLSAVLVLAVLAGWFWWQQNGLSSETLSVTSAPDGFAGYRVAVISDLHAKEFGQDNERLLEYVQDLEPDLIAVVGDLIHAPEQMEMVPRWPGPGGHRPPPITSPATTSGPPGWWRSWSPCWRRAASMSSPTTM